MSLLYGYPVKRPGDTSRLARADLKSPYSLDDVHARIEAETHEYEHAATLLSSRSPRRRARVLELFLGFVFHDSFVLWRTDSWRGADSLKLDLTLSDIPGGTSITITSDIRNDSLSRIWIAIGIGLPAVVGSFSGAFIASSWIPAAIGAAIAIGISVYILFIRKWLVREFIRSTVELREIVDPYGMRDNSTPLSGHIWDEYRDD